MLALPHLSSQSTRETALETSSTARSEFLALALATLARFNKELTPSDPSQLSLDSRLELSFTVHGIEFSLVHATDPQTDRLLLMTCLLGPLPRNGEHEACARLLAANYELSTTHLSAFALDESENAVYTHSCVVGTSKPGNLAILIEGLAGLSMQWRSNHIPAVHELSLRGQKADAAFAFA